MVNPPPFIDAKPNVLIMDFGLEFYSLKKYWLEAAQRKGCSILESLIGPHTLLCFLILGLVAPSMGEVCESGFLLEIAFCAGHSLLEFTVD
ncbi:hypothetical protein ACSQ67_002114 [Phaseolus vulgaris]